MNFGDVHSRANNHKNIVNWQFAICNLEFAIWKWCECQLSA